MDQTSYGQKLIEKLDDTHSVWYSAYKMPWPFGKAPLHHECIMSSLSHTRYGTASIPKESQQGDLVPSATHVAMCLPLSYRRALHMTYHTNREAHNPFSLPTTDNRDCVWMSMDWIDGSRHEAACLGRSTTHDSAPQRNGHVRVQMLHSGFTLQRVAQPQEKSSEEATTRVTFLAQVFVSSCMQFSL